MEVEMISNALLPKTFLLFPVILYLAKKVLKRHGTVVR